MSHLITVTVRHEVEVTYTMFQSAALDARRVNFIRGKLDDFARTLKREVETVGFDGVKI